MRHLAASLILSFMSGSVLAGANFIVINDDSPSVGFNDNTPVTPVGGNTGTTLGEQRMIAFEFAAGLWGGVVDSNITIRVSASFAPLFCTSNSATLGSAGPTTIHADFGGAAFSQTWYPQALANSLSGTDRSGQSDMDAEFNGDIDFNNGCLSGTNWYYGLDNNNPGGTIDFLNTVMHEIAHGLGFIGFTDLSSGSLAGGIPGIFARFSLDNDDSLHWNEMNDSQRAISATNNGGLVWDGPNTALLASFSLSGGKDANGFPRLYAPNNLSEGSSVFHWDTATSPNTLMEPFQTGSLAASETLDLTPTQMKDIGWPIIDIDQDLIPDIYDNCPADENIDQADDDNDGIGDVCDACSGADADEDGIPDACDNCTLVFNPDQYDSDADGFGNSCDADLNNDNFVNFADLSLLANAFFTSPAIPGWNPDADFDNSGIINFADLQMMATGFFLPPGPSGLAP
ncbi:MAG: thrombospondin type 3 repeat-containing protein [Gammaproteobacteria bacterium]|nr:thrombospondin type 3 repeat-containing protein [Gammaproteobacteria bacterium]MDH3766866.1 thrombospondin type 3 repeat-containing protein [Gammaproteobacteria bacterium]